MCELKPYCDKNCEECALAETVEKLKNEFIECFKPFIDTFFESIKQISAMMPELSKTYNKGLWIGSYPNKKVIHLALHHPRERTRKKNINRIYKWLKKEGAFNDT